MKKKILKEVKEKINKGIDFRKVNNFDLNGNDEFSFILEAILSEELKKDYNITLSIISLIGNYKKEKYLYCSCKILPKINLLQDILNV